MNQIIKKIKNLDVFSLGVSSALYYVLIFYFVPILVLLGWDAPSHYTDINKEAIIYASLGFASLILGYLVLPKKTTQKLPNPFRKEWNKNAVIWTFAIVFVLGLLFKLVRIFGGGYFHINPNLNFLDSPFFSAVGLFTWFGPIALIIAFAWYYYLRKSGQAYKTWRNIAWGTLVLEMFYAVPSCSREFIIIPIALILLVRWYIWRQAYAPFVLAAGLFILLIMPFGNACRHIGVANIVSGDNVSGTISDTPSYIAESSLTRVDQFNIFSKILNSDLPRLYGRDYYKFFVSLGPPRFIWKDKPVIVPDGNEFGKKIGAISESNNSTGVGPTVLGDFYINFGLPGIIIGMFLLGAVFRLIYEYLIQNTAFSLSGVMIYSIFWVQLIKGMENWMVPIWAGLVKMTVILLVIHFVISRQKIYNVKTSV